MKQGNIIKFLIGIQDLQKANRREEKGGGGGDEEKSGKKKEMRMIKQRI